MRYVYSTLPSLSSLTCCVQSCSSRITYLYSTCNPMGGHWVVGGVSKTWQSKSGKADSKQQRRQQQQPAAAVATRSSTTAAARRSPLPPRPHLGAGGQLDFHRPNVAWVPGGRHLGDGQEGPAKGDLAAAHAQHLAGVHAVLHREADAAGWRQGGWCGVEAGGGAGAKVGGCGSGRLKQGGSGCSGEQSRSRRARKQSSTVLAATSSARSGPQRWIAERQRANICAHHIAAEQAAAAAHQHASCQLAACPTSLALQQRRRGHKPYPAQQPALAKHARIGAAAHRTSGGVARSAAPSSRPGNWRKELPDCSLLRSKLSPAR